VEILAATASASPSSRVTSPVLQSDFKSTFIPVSGAASATEKTSRMSSERTGKGVVIKSQLTVGLLMAPSQRLSGLAWMRKACVDRHEFVQKGNWARISTADRETRAQLCQPWGDRPTRTR
jgi:hypothetical protein